MTKASISKALAMAVAKSEQLLQQDATVKFPAYLPKKIYFKQGNGVEIAAKLTAMTQTQSTTSAKYPLVWLFRDAKEKLKYNGDGFDVSGRFKIIIISLTKKEYSSDEREKQNFEPILRPVFLKLVEAIQSMNEFNRPNYDSFDIEIYERFYWGSNQVEQKTNDPVDAIELDIFLTVKELKKFC